MFHVKAMMQIVDAHALNVVTRTEIDCDFSLVDGEDGDLKSGQLAKIRRLPV